MNNSISKKTILLVEDDIDLCNALTLLLNDKYTVVVAYSLKSAVQHFNANHISAVLLDYKLPDGEGIEFLKQIRALSRLLPVVVITAHNSVEFKNNMLTQGVNDFFLKPFNPDALTQALDQAIEQIAILNTYLPIDEIFIPRHLYIAN